MKTGTKRSERKWNGSAAQKKSAAGMCPFCSVATPIFKGSRCEKHYKAHLARRHVRIDKLLASGLCSSCGKQPLHTKRHCSLCALRHNEKTRASRKGETMRNVCEWDIDAGVVDIVCRIQAANCLGDLVAVDRLIDRRFADHPTVARVLSGCVGKKVAEIVVGLFVRVSKESEREGQCEA